MVEGVTLVQGIQLPLEPPSVEEACNFALADLGVHASVDALKDTGHPDKDGGLQLPNVIHEALDVPSPVPKSGAQVQEELLTHPADPQTSDCLHPVFELLVQFGGMTSALFLPIALSDASTMCICFSRAQAAHCYCDAHGLHSTH